MTGGPYNPLDKLSLARSIETELLKRDCRLLSDVEGIAGAGVYVIYYTGDFPTYTPIAEASRDGQFKHPIYVGKAIPKGGRKGGLAKDASKGRALADRLRQHASSISDARNLRLEEFHFRYLVIDDIWIPLGENMLIETFKPVWNLVIDGFGNKDPGNRRATQYKSPWDVLHPGRSFADKLADSPTSVDMLKQRINDYFAGRPLANFPKIEEARRGAEQSGAEDGVDEV